MLIYLKGIFKPLGSNGMIINVRETSHFKEFNINGVKITFTPNTPDIQADLIIDGNESLLSYYKDINGEIPRNPVFEEHRDKIYQTVRSVLKYFKYFYGIKELDENLRLSENIEWSLNQQDWFKLPNKRETRWLPGNIVYMLDNNFLAWIPQLIERNMEPFFAFTHLHKAFAETNTRHQWINATIAAELAFKEFLSQYDERATSLITQVPSPPLNKLYRDVLKEYTGEESPMHAKLGKGAERRNHLIHRTTEPSPLPKESLITFLRFK